MTSRRALAIVLAAVVVAAAIVAMVSYTRRVESNLRKAPGPMTNKSTGSFAIFSAT